LLLNPPRRLGAGRRIVRIRDLGIDLVLIVPVVADRRADPAGVNREYLGSGV
jgi:hypothetical protein